MIKKYKSMLYISPLIIILSILIVLFLSHPRSEDNIYSWLLSHFESNKAELYDLVVELEDIGEVNICGDSNSKNEYNYLLEDVDIECISKYEQMNHVKLYWSDITIRGMHDRYGFVYVYTGEQPDDNEIYSSIERIEGSWFAVQY